MGESGRREKERPKRRRLAAVQGRVGGRRDAMTRKEMDSKKQIRQQRRSSRHMEMQQRAGQAAWSPSRQRQGGEGGHVSGSGRGRPHRNESSNPKAGGAGKQGQTLRAAHGNGVHSRIKWVLRDTGCRVLLYVDGGARDHTGGVWWGSVRAKRGVGVSDRGGCNAVGWDGNESDQAVRGM